ncbi:stromal cell-derived factor 1 [Phyllobates terribilis]|uniref:stromal cell-derived factor 1 n=1 Tax=Phyllobates terribilis TaxID=111132 RepID=UPI003CCAEF10
MDVRHLALLTLLLGMICSSEEKPVSLTYRCPCRYFESNVSKSNIKHLKILSTTNCSLQIVARLKHNGKQICLDPKIKWIQEYLEKALNKKVKT